MQRAPVPPLPTHTHTRSTPTHTHAPRHPLALRMYCASYRRTASLRNATVFTGSEAYPSRSSSRRKPPCAAASAASAASAAGSGECPATNRTTSPRSRSRLRGGGGGGGGGRSSGRACVCRGAGKPGARGSSPPSPRPVQRLLGWGEPSRPQRAPPRLVVVLGVAVVGGEAGLHPHHRHDAWAAGQRLCRRCHGRRVAAPLCPPRGAPQLIRWRSGGQHPHQQGAEHAGGDACCKPGGRARGWAAPPAAPTPQRG